MTGIINNPPRVVGLGSCTVDYFAMTPRLIGPEEKINVKELHVLAGGVTANNLTQVARLGVRTGWFGKIGGDDNGRIIMRGFEEDGFDTSCVKVIKDELSSFAWIPVDPMGERLIYMFSNVTAKITAEEIEREFSDYIRGAESFHTEVSQLPLGPVVKALEIARAAGVRTILDLDVDTDYFVNVSGLGTMEQLKKAIELSDVLKPCKGAARSFTGSSDPRVMAEKMLDLGPRLVAVTAGGEGCVLADRDQTVHAPAFKVPVKDTTGAGDAFQGGLSFGLLQPGWSLEQIGRFANACAAFCCTQVGARAMGDREQIEKLMAS